MKRIPVIVAAVAALLLAGSVLAAKRIVVNGLFANKAVVTVDGRQRILSVGKRSPEGLLLISASSRSAVIEVQGERRTYYLGKAVGSSSYSSSGGRGTSVQIAADSRGMYHTSGTINGQPVNFLVDTGATVVAMNRNEARRLGIQYRLTGRPAYVRTASSARTQAWALYLDSVRVGNIRLRHVQAVVIESSQPSQVLLGMSFLRRLKMENQGRIMTLTKTR